MTVFILNKGYTLVFLSLIFLILIPCCGYAQAPAWQRAVALVNTLEVAATATGANGAVYVAGRFSGYATLGNSQLASAGRTDIFVARWNPAANAFDWAVRAGGADTETVTALAVSGSSVYLAGSFHSPTAPFGGITLANSNPSSSYDELFVAKIADTGVAGSFAWALASQRVIPAGAQGGMVASALAAHGTSIYLTGMFQTPAAMLGGLTLTNTDPTYNTSDIFVAKLTDSGTAGSVAWAVAAGGRFVDQASALAVSGTSVYVAGAFLSSTFRFGATTLVNTSNSSAFVAKMTDAGTTASLGWAQQATGGALSYITALAARGNSVYAAGTFQAAALTLGATTLPLAGASNLFVTKLADAGATAAFGWAVQSRSGPPGTSGVALGEAATALAVNGNGVYVAGRFGGTTATLGGLTLPNASATGLKADVLLARLRDNGATATFEWATRAGGADDDEALGLALNSTTVFVAGGAVPPATFGSLGLAAPGGVRHGFLATLADPLLTGAVRPAAPAGLAVWPNPAHNQALLALPARSSFGYGQLFDAQGRAVRCFPLPAQATAVELPVAGLPAGLYLLRVGRATARLVVE